MRPEDRELAELCTLCPGLCRDRCPVLQHSGWDFFAPHEKVRSALTQLGYRDGPTSREALEACTDCGACTAACKLEVPVAQILEEARAELTPPTRLPELEELPAEEAPASARFLVCCQDEESSDADPLRPPRGSSCCGARLPAGVGDPELRQRMAEGMLTGLPAGQELWVKDPLCGAHLRALGYPVRHSLQERPAG